MEFDFVLLSPGKTPTSVNDATDKHVTAATVEGNGDSETISICKEESREAISDNRFFNALVILGLFEPKKRTRVMRNLSNLRTQGINACLGITERAYKPKQDFVKKVFFEQKILANYIEKAEFSEDKLFEFEETVVRAIGTGTRLERHSRAG